jgi:prepilin-type N-terminal cleavage/methylation domain-containing protein
MEMSRAATRQFRSEERGFTLPEVLITIVIMGIVFAIASSSWFSTIERRAVDTTNQLVADLRLLVASVAVWSAGRNLLLLPFLGRRNPEILANLAGEVVGYLGVSGTGVVSPVAGLR